jgi:thymidylate synthase (FAD)
MTHHQDLTVHLLSRPAIDDKGVRGWLEDLDPGALDWWTAQQGTATDPELLIELAGKRCYKSFTVGANPNVTRIRTEHEAYIGNILHSRHGSVLEHGMFVFGIEGVSRVLTHELVRHRVGTSISQESGRYVRLDDIAFRMPQWVLDNPKLNAMAMELLLDIEEFQVTAAAEMGLDDPGVPFHVKKAITSDMRRFAPDGRLTGLVWGANLRSLRLLIELRTAAGAEEEIRQLFGRIAEIVVDEAPLVFGDFEVGGDGSWAPRNSKV